MSASSRFDNHGNPTRGHRARRGRIDEGRTVSLPRRLVRLRDSAGETGIPDSCTACETASPSYRDLRNPGRRSQSPATSGGTAFESQVELARPTPSLRPSRISPLAPASAPGNSKAGSTLVELLVVLGCAAALTLGAIPGYQRLTQEWKLRGSASLVLASLQWGRAHAVSSNSPILFHVEEGGQRFWWIDPETDDVFRGTVRELAAGVRIAESPKRPLRFYPRGNAVPAGSFVIEGQAGRYRVVVNVAGRIRIERDR